MSTQQNTNEQASGAIGEAAPESVDVQIVGAGLAGLIAANLALDAGLTVRLIEAQPTAGGRAGSASRDGFTLNHGPHALYVDGELRSILGSLDINPTGAPPTVTGATGSIGSTVGLLPQGPRTLLTTSLLPLRGKRQLARLMARLGKLDTEALNSTTVTQWLNDTTDGPELKALLTGLINLSTYSFAPDIYSAGAALAQLQKSLGSGVLYLDRGWVSIVDELESRLKTRHTPSGNRGHGRFDRVTARVTAITADPAGGHVCQTADRRHASDHLKCLLFRSGDIAVDKPL
jgi:phytoene dehydrogenase-like protein